MKQIKFKKPPFFKPGSLVFRGSGHTLIKDGKYYRCGKNSNQVCVIGERQINAENLEKKFSRLASKLYDKDLDADFLVEKLMRKNLCDLIFNTDKRVRGPEEVADSTLAVIEAEVRDGKMIKKSDLKDFDESVLGIIKEDHSVMLFGYAISMIRAFSVKLPEAEMGRTLAHFAKKIYVTDKGEICEIELERWAWYCLNIVIEKNKPGYLEKRKSVHISNEFDELHDKDIVEAALSFGTDDFPDAMGEDFVLSIGMVKALKDCLEVAVKGDISKINEGIPVLLNQVLKNPAVGIILRTLSMAGVKIK